MGSSRQLPVSPAWFAVTWVTERTAVLTEPHVDGLLQADLWYLRGRERDLLVDTGNGAASLRPVLARFAHGGRRDVLCLVTHAHTDHIGGYHEFERRLLHAAEVDAAARISDEALLSGDAIYEGGLIDTLPESDVAQYVRTMERLRTLDVDVVYPGHGEPFGRERLHELAEEYLREHDG